MNKKHLKKKLLPTATRWAEGTRVGFGVQERERKVEREEDALR